MHTITIHGSVASAPILIHRDGRDDLDGAATRQTGPPTAAGARQRAIARFSVRTHDLALGTVPDTGSPRTDIEYDVVALGFLAEAASDELYPGVAVIVSGRMVEGGRWLEQSPNAIPGIEIQAFDIGPSFLSTLVSVHGSRRDRTCALPGDSERPAS